VVRRRGRISALLELGTAFYPEASGRENIYQYATAMQISRAEIESRMSAIIEYAELGADIDYPLRNYSSGMVARLAFAVACSVEPDLLIVDETLAVGDIAFRHKALSTIQRVRDSGATILFVTHNPAQVIGLADRALVIEKGKIIAEGRPADVVPIYQRMMLSGRAEAAPVRSGAEVAATDIETDLSAGGMRYGTGAGRLLGVAVCVGGQRVQSLDRAGPVTVRISWRAELPIEHPNVGFLIKNEQGVVVTSANLQMCGLFLPAMRPDDVRTAEFSLELPQLECNSYSIHPTLADGLGRDAVYLDSVEHACIFKVTHGDETYGIIRVPAEVRVR
jgi:ABC-type glutathione transport system ATPase component